MVNAVEALVGSGNPSSFRLWSNIKMTEIPVFPEFNLLGNQTPSYIIEYAIPWGNQTASLPTTFSSSSSCGSCSVLSKSM